MNLIIQIVSSLLLFSTPSLFPFHISPGGNAWNLNYRQHSHSHTHTLLPLTTCSNTCQTLGTVAKAWKYLGKKKRGGGLEYSSQQYWILSQPFNSIANCRGAGDCSLDLLFAQEWWAGDRSATPSPGLNLNRSAAGLRVQPKWISVAVNGTPRREDVAKLRMARVQQLATCRWNHSRDLECSNISKDYLCFFSSLHKISLYY